MKKNNWIPILGIMLTIFIAGIFVGSEISISIADEFSKFEKIEVEVTAYSPDPDQTMGNPFETASTQIVTPQDLNEFLYAAASRDLLKKFTPDAPLDYGDKIYLEITIIDTMHSRWTNSIDLFLANKTIANLFGRQPNRTIIIERKER